MISCLNLGDENIAKMVKDFGEINVSKLLDTNFPKSIPTYEQFIANKNVKQDLGLVPISKVKDEIGRSMPKEISTNQLISLKATVSAINNRNYRNGVNTVYSLYNVAQVGQSDLNTWGLKKSEGNLNVEAKLERAKNRVVDQSQSAMPVSILEQMIDNDDYMAPLEEVSPEEQALIEQARQIQREDAERLGVDYDDDYMFQLTSDAGIKAEEDTIRDIATKLTDRIGIKAKIINDPLQEFKGKLDYQPLNFGTSKVNYSGSERIAIINLAYATLDTPIHEIIGHPIISAIKNKYTKGESTGYDFLDEKDTGSRASKSISLVKEAIKNPEKYKTEKFYHYLDISNAIDIFGTTEEIFLQKANDFITSKSDQFDNKLYQNLLKELETGVGKEVYDRVERTYGTAKKEIRFYENPISEADRIENAIAKNALDNFTGVYNKKFTIPGDTNSEYEIVAKGPDINLYQYTKETKENLENEAIVELLGLMVADKIDKKQNSNLIKLLKDLLKRISDVVKNLIGAKEVEIAKLPENLTLGDIADIIAYGNNKLILPGYEVKYTTPDNKSFSTYGEASQHISKLASLKTDLDINDIKGQKAYEVSYESDSSKDVLGGLFKKSTVKKGKTSFETKELLDAFVDNVQRRGVRITEIKEIDNYIAKDFLDRNLPYEQANVIIKEWKEKNNIVYDPNEVYSRGQGFYSAVGAYSNLDIDLLFQNLLDNIDINEKAGGEFVISAFTKPVDKKIEHLEGGSTVNFEIYPKPEDIKWASNVDVYSGSTWDASVLISRSNLRKEQVGVSYTKTPHINNLSKVTPNLADTIDKLAHHHNELGIRLTKNNFRLKASNNTSISTKKLVDGINKILDQKYGPVEKPVVNNKIQYRVYSESMYTSEPDVLGVFKTVAKAKEAISKQPIDFQDQFYIEDVIDNLDAIQPKINFENIKFPIEGIKSKVIGKTWNSLDEYYYNNKSYADFPYRDQGIINAKIDKLKSVAKAFPRILIRSEVVPNEKARQDALNSGEELDFQKIPIEVNPTITESELNQQIEEVKRMDSMEPEQPEFDVNNPQNIKGRDIAIKLAEKLQKAFGMQYEVITPEMAAAILEKTPTPYNNQPAFFHANKIYIIDSAVSTDNVIHEFAHPLIKGILKQNPELFANLFSQLSATVEGQEIIAQIKAEYPNLQKGSDRFMEEAMVTAIERSAEVKPGAETAFGKFMEKLMFGLKKVLRALFTGKTATKLNLNKLSPKTTLNQLADMLANDEFVIEDLKIEPSITAEFKNEISDRIEELKNVPRDQLQLQIDRLYNDTMKQLNALKQAPFKLKEELLASKGTNILNYVREELEKYQTVNINMQEVDPNNIIKAVSDLEQEMKLRSLALINSLNELRVFAENIDGILDEIKGSKNQTNENISKVTYYKGFLKNQQELIANLKEAPGLSKDSLFYKTLNSINDSIEKANKKIKDIEFNFISEFFTNETELMGEEVEKNFRERATIILKAENISQEDIDKFVEKVINNPDGKSMTTKDIGLNINARRAKLVVDAAKEYYFKRLGRQQIDEYLRGERGDLGYFTNWITPYSNMDDPLAGGFVKFIKTKMSDALTRSQNQADEITVKLLPLLNAVGYNPAKTNQLGDMLLFTDKIGYTNAQGVFEEKDVLTFINKFKNYRSDRARLQNDFDAAKNSKDPIKMKEAYEAIQDFDEKYMHRRYTKEFYDIQKIWKTGAKVKNLFTGEEITIGPKVAFESFLERQQGLDKMSTLKNVHFLELEDLYELGDSEEQARLEYNRLFDIYGLDGKPKSGEELERVLLRKRHRELSRGMYDYDIDTDRIQKDLNNFSSQLIARGIDPDGEPKEGETQNLYQKEIERFFRKNLKTAYTSEYYKTRQQIFEDIKKITEKAGVKSQVAVDLSELYKERYRLANSTADNNGQPNGINFTPEQIDLLRDIEEQIVKLEESFDKKTGLSQEESLRLKTYIKKSANKTELTPEEQKDYAYLYQVKNDMALTPIELVTLRSKFNELAELSSKQATEYYIEAFNYAIRNLGLPEITVENADEWINSDNLTQAMAASKDFTQWYTRNHYDKMVYDGAFGKKMPKNYRLNVWTISKPTSDASYQKTTLIDPVTKQKITLDGIPSGKYTKSKIKDSYLTIPRGENWDKYTGTIIDNRGNFLPREYKPGNANSAFDNKYVNEKYTEMEKTNSVEFQLLNAVTESMLKVQQGKALNSRLYLDMPRFRKRSNLEYVQSGETQKNIGEKINSFKDVWQTWFGKSPDDVEYGYNFDAGSLLVSTDLEGNAKTKIPVRGTYNLDADVVSKDVLRGMYEYLLSLNEQETLMENEPIAQALSSVLDENPIKRLGQIDKDEFKLTGNKKFLTETTNNRKGAIDYLIGKTFYGQVNSDFEKQNPGITKFFQGLFRRSSRAFIAFDPQSAIKNRWGMLYQNMIYAAGGKNITIASLAKGKLKAKESAMYWVFKDAYAKGMKTQDIQLIERFDPSLRTEKDFGKSSSRSIAKDLSDMTYMFDFRRTMEFEATMELFWGAMYNKYIDQVHDDGSITSITYADAWTTDSDGVLQLKEGIDPNYGFREVNHIYTSGETLSGIAKKYNITEEQLKKRSGISSISELTPGQEIIVGNGTEFNRMKLLIQGINKKATGTMDRFDTPHAEKYLFYRAFTFYKRFATGMFLDKYQFDTTKGNRGGFVYNWDTMTLEKGYYPTAFQNIYQLAKSLMKDWALMTNDEKIAMRKVITEGLLLFLLSMVVGSWYFGYDPEDEERGDKIKARNETWGGYFGNHLLYLLMMTKVENKSFVPVIGFKDWTNYMGSTTIATKNTVDVYLKIMEDLWQISTNNPDAIYQQPVGPYKWQEKGRYKLWNHIGTMYGIKGKNRDPYWAIKKYETFENLN